MIVSKSYFEDGNDWEKLCDLAGLPKTDEKHPWNERAFAQIEITSAKLFKYNHVHENESI